MIDLKEFLRPHQYAVLDDISNGKILKGGVGSGKTHVAVAYYLKNEAPKDVYVITPALKRDKFDWQETFYSAGVGPRSGPVHHGDRVLEEGESNTEGNASSADGREDVPRRRDAGVRGVREGESRKLERGVAGRTDPGGSYPWSFTVDSWNNIGKYADVAGAFFIFDEQRLVGSGKWARQFLRIAKRNHWILLTATPGDTWMDYFPVFIANGFYKNRSEAVREHVVYSPYAKFPKVERYINQGRLIRQRKQLIVEMPFERLTTRHVIPVMCEYDKDLVETVLKKRWHVFEDRPLRDISEMISVTRKVVNSHPSRLARVQDAMQKHPRLIIFYNFNYELELLRGLSTSIQMAEWNGHKHQAVPETTSWLYLVQYAAGSDAWNCTTTDAELLYSKQYSWRTEEQVQGRIDRLNTPFRDLYYYGLTSDSWIDKAIQRSLNAKEVFNEAKFKSLMG